MKKPTARSFREVIATVAVGFVAVAFQSGCSGSVSTGAKSATGEVSRRDTRIVHEECDIKSLSAEKIDANGD